MSNHKPELPGVNDKPLESAVASPPTQTAVDWMSIARQHLLEAENTGTEEQLRSIADVIRVLEPKKHAEILNGLPKLTAKVKKKSVPKSFGVFTSFSAIMEYADYRKRKDIVGKAVTALWEI